MNTEYQNPKTQLPRAIKRDPSFMTDIDLFKSALSACKLPTQKPHISLNPTLYMLYL